MSANVENMVSVREVPWHGIGTIVDKAMTAADALKLGGLDWEVQLRPTLIPTEPWTDLDEVPPPDKLRFTPEHFTTVRSTDGKVLGRVGRNYVPLQNTDAFEFFDNVVDDGRAKYETAGSLGNGKQVWLTAKVPESMQVAGVDQVDVYLLLSNSHDGSKAVTVAVTPIRVVCQNTLNLGIAKAQRLWRVRHLSNLSGKIAEARDALELTFKYVDIFEETANELAKAKFTDKQFDDFLTAAVKEFAGFPPSKIDEMFSGIKTVYKESDNLANVRGTRWAALNAVGEYFEWYRPTTDTARVKSTWAGAARKNRDRALQLLRV